MIYINKPWLAVITSLLAFLARYPDVTPLQSPYEILMYVKTETGS